MQFWLFSEDLIYKRNFQRHTAPLIYQAHINENYVSCVFCLHLSRSQCHDYCFSCSKGVYRQCSPLLPGTFHFSDSYFDTMGRKSMPWFFKTPCTRFERLKNSRYFKHFLSKDISITAANLETLEGLFTGMSRGKRPCHICASVNLDIFNSCSKAEKEIDQKPCKRITGEIASIYRASSGMTIYAD